MALRIAFDMDGVLADMESELSRQAETLFGASALQSLRESPAEPADEGQPAAAEANGIAASAPVIATLHMSSRQQNKLWRHVQSIENFWQTLNELEPGAIPRLAAVAVERRWEIIFLTKRPETAGSTAQVQSQRWLEAKGFPLPSVYVVQGSRGRIADALGIDIVVDDRPENCLDVVMDSRARAILVWRDDETKLPSAAKRLGIGIVKSVNECLDILTQIDAAPSQGGLMTRVKRALGFKEPVESA